MNEATMITMLNGTLIVKNNTTFAKRQTIPIITVKGKSFAFLIALLSFLFLCKKMKGFHAKLLKKKHKCAILLKYYLILIDGDRI